MKKLEWNNIDLPFTDRELRVIFHLARKASQDVYTQEEVSEHLKEEWDFVVETTDKLITMLDIAG